MAYIYQIQNDINGKIYIGETEYSIEKRFKEHCADAFRERNEKRPLYAAMRKYGIEHFHINLIEETDTPDEREIYWIEHKQTFKYGYNATKGGEGKRYIDYEEVVAVYNKVQNCKQTARLLNISVYSVYDILNDNNILIKPSQEINKENYSKMVALFEVTNKKKPLKVFSSAKEAARYLIQKEFTKSQNVNGISAHIGQVCNKKRNSAYGYYWEFLDSTPAIENKI